MKQKQILFLHKFLSTQQTKITEENVPYGTGIKMKSIPGPI